MEKIFNLVRKIPTGILSFVALGVVVYLTLIYTPSQDGPELFEGADKVVHFILFFCFQAAITLDILSRMPAGCEYSKKARLIKAFILQGVFVAAMTEFLQDQLDLGRTADLGDFIADLLGCVVACILLLLAVRSKFKE